MPATLSISMLATLSTSMTSTLITTSNTIFISISGILTHQGDISKVGSRVHSLSHWLRYSVSAQDAKNYCTYYATKDTSLVLHRQSVSPGPSFCCRQCVALATLRQVFQILLKSSFQLFWYCTTTESEEKPFSGVFSGCSYSSNIGINHAIQMVGWVDRVKFFVSFP